MSHCPDYVERVPDIAAQHPRFACSGARTALALLLE
jgi:hypothetical protein